MGIPSFQEIHIEGTNACRYKCFMCPREELTRSIGHMPLEDFSLILERVGPFEGIVHLHGFGESLLDRAFLSKIEQLKQRNPKACAVVFSTLGVRLQETFFFKMIEAGLDKLAISLYGFSEESYTRVHGFNGLALVKHNLETLARAMQTSNNKSFSAYIKVPGESVSSALPLASSKKVDKTEKAEFCHWAEGLGFTIREWSYLHNYGDGRSYNPPGERMCPVIQGKRKHILNVAWNLDILPCAYDFNGAIRFGNLKTHSLEEIFSSPEYFSFLLAHTTKDLSSYKICQSCEKTDYE